MVDPQTNQEVNELVRLEQALFCGLRLWLYNHRSTGKGARQKREAAKAFMDALRGYRDVIGEQEFGHLYPLVSEELEGLILHVR
jgi:hypothetical protein